MTTHEAIKLCQSEEWEIEHSSLARIAKGKVTHQQCREYACSSIANGLTNIDDDRFPIIEIDVVSIGGVSIIEIPRGTDFHLIGRVDTEWYKNDPWTYYMNFEKRTFASFSTICKKNISHYCNALFYIYSHAEDIVHIFPMDSNTKKYVGNEKDLTALPSLWLTLSELEDLTAELGVYNQVTCRTKRNGQIIRPIAVAAFDIITDKILKVAIDFGIKIILIHTDPDAVNYKEDIIEFDHATLDSASRKLYEQYGIPVKEIVLPG